MGGDFRGTPCAPRAGDAGAVGIVRACAWLVLCTSLALRRSGGLGVVAFRLRLRFGGWLGFRAPGSASRFGVARFGVTAARRLLLGALLVVFAAVVGDVEPAPFENESRAAANHLADLAAPARLLRAELWRAAGQGLVRHRLELLKLVATLLARVLVSRHNPDDSTPAALHGRRFSRPSAADGSR